MKFSPIGRVCSFCGLVGTASTNFAGGLGAMMCQDCLDMYTRLFATRESILSIRRPPWEQLSDEELLAKLPLISAAAEQSVEYLRDWVGLARERGLSWTDIGAALGISRQAAWERFSKGRSGA